MKASDKLESVEETSKPSVSRRNFLTGAAALAAGAAVAGLVACTNNSDSDSDSGSNKTEAVGPIPTAWDIETDVLVAGSGCGLGAAVTAAEAGVDVVVVEAGDHFGGLYLPSGGNSTLGGNNIIQQRDGIEGDSEELWYQEEMYSCEYRGNPDTMRMLVQRGPEMIEWMQGLGIIWAPMANGALRPGIKRGMTPAENPGVYAGGQTTFNSGISWTQVWLKRLEELGVDTLLHHRLIKLYRDGDGPVVGALIDNEGTEVKIKARKGVVLATGTWTDNDRMVYAWDPRLVGENCYGDGGIPSENRLLVNSAGDGHLAAAEIGAGFADMSFVSYVYLFYGSRSYWGWGEDPIDWTTNDNFALGQGIPRTDDFFKNIILVHDGVRYINECEGYRPNLPGRGGHSENPELPYTRTYLELPQPRNVWAVGDAASAEACKWPLDQINNPNVRTGYMLDPACLAVADTIEDLAVQMNVDPATLKNTVDTYNAYVDAGKDDDFGRPEFGNKIETAPFYGFKVALVRHTQRNGLRVNTKLQVLEQSGQRGYTFEPHIDNEPVIPHLYACGEIGNAVGYRRIHNTIGHYATCARVAGESAAAETSVE